MPGLSKILDNIKHELIENLCIYHSELEAQQLLSQLLVVERYNLNYEVKDHQPTITDFRSIQGVIDQCVSDDNKNTIISTYLKIRIELFNVYRRLADKNEIIEELVISILSILKSLKLTIKNISNGSTYISILFEILIAEIYVLKSLIKFHIEIDQLDFTKSFMEMLNLDYRLESYKSILCNSNARQNTNSHILKAITDKLNVFGIFKRKLGNSINNKNNIRLHNYFHVTNYRLLYKFYLYFYKKLSKFNVRNSENIVNLNFGNSLSKDYHINKRRIFCYNTNDTIPLYSPFIDDPISYLSKVFKEVTLCCCALFGLFPNSPNNEHNNFMDDFCLSEQSPRLTSKTFDQNSVPVVVPLEQNLHPLFIINSDNFIKCMPTFKKICINMVMSQTNDENIHTSQDNNLQYFFVVYIKPRCFLGVVAKNITFKTKESLSQHIYEFRRKLNIFQST